MRSNNRRNFLKSVAAIGAAVAISTRQLSASALCNNDTDESNKDFTILFQGDSITDGNRSRNNDWNHVMGHGYQYIIASKLWYDFPKRNLHFFNRGISGNKVTDLAERWQQDTLDLKPDLLSILIGINDVDALIKGDKDFTSENYESVYRLLLEQTKEKLPGILFVLCEPFVLPVGKVKDKWQEYLSEVQHRQEAVKKLAKEFDGIHVPFQQAFNKALTKSPAEYWIWDGIHPMPAGHELMAKEWMKEVRKKLTFIK